MQKEEDEERSDFYFFEEQFPDAIIQNNRKNSLSPLAQKDESPSQNQEIKREQLYLRSMMNYQSIQQDLDHYPKFQTTEGKRQKLYQFMNANAEIDMKHSSYVKTDIDFLDGQMIFQRQDPELRDFFEQQQLNLQKNQGFNNNIGGSNLFINQQKIQPNQETPIFQQQVTPLSVPLSGLNKLKPGMPNPLDDNFDLGESHNPNDESIMNQMRKTQRKGSSNFLPSFTDQLTTMVENLIQQTNPSQYSQFSKGQDILLTNMKNFIEIEKEGFQNQSYYFKQYFQPNYQRLIDKLLMYHDQHRLNGQQFLMFVSSFGIVLIEDLLAFIKKCDSTYLNNLQQSKQTLDSSVYKKIKIEDIQRNLFEGAQNLKSDLFSKFQSESELVGFQEQPFDHNEKLNFNVNNYGLDSNNCKNIQFQPENIKGNQTSGLFNNSINNNFQNSNLNGAVNFNNNINNNSCKIGNGGHLEMSLNMSKANNIGSFNNITPMKSQLPLSNNFSSQNIANGNCYGGNNQIFKNVLNENQLISDQFNDDSIYDSRKGAGTRKQFSQQEENAICDLLRQYNPKLIPESVIREVAQQFDRTIDSIKSKIFQMKQKIFGEDAISIGSSQSSNNQERQMNGSSNFSYPNNTNFHYPQNQNNIFTHQNGFMQNGSGGSSFNSMVQNNFNNNFNNNTNNNTNPGFNESLSFNTNYNGNNHNNINNSNYNNNNNNPFQFNKSNVETKIQTPIAPPLNVPNYFGYNQNSDYFFEKQDDMIPANSYISQTNGSYGLSSNSSGRNVNINNMNPVEIQNLDGKCLNSMEQKILNVLEVYCANNRGTKQEICQIIKDKFYNGNSIEDQLQSISMNLSKCSQIVKEKGIYGLNLPLKSDYISLNDTNNNKNKVVFILQQISGNKATLKKIVESYQQIFGDPETLKDPQQLKSNISKTLVQNDIFDQSASKTTYILVKNEIPPLQNGFNVDH